MARDYRRWLIPKGNVFFPSGAGIAKLVTELRKEKWLVDPASDAFKSLRFDAAPLAAKSGVFSKRAVEVSSPRNPAAGWEAVPHPLEGAWLDDPDRCDLALRWPVRPVGDFLYGPTTLKHPLTRADELPKGAGYDLEIHRSDEFTYPLSQHIDALDAECHCGEDLSFEWDEDEIQSPFGAAIGIFAECEDCSRTFDPSKREADVEDPLTGKKTPVRGGAAYRFALVVDCGSAFPEGAPLPTFHPDLKALIEAAFGRDFYEIGVID